jgi:hypothetical protein
VVVVLVVVIIMAVFGVIVVVIIVGLLSSDLGFDLVDDILYLIRNCLFCLLNFVSDVVDNLGSFLFGLFDSL